MKKTFRKLGMFIIVILVSISLTNCGDDDKDPKDSSDSLVGVWVQRYEPAHFYTIYTLKIDEDGKFSYIESDYNYHDDSLIDQSFALGNWTAKNGVFTVKVLQADAQWAIGEEISISYTLRGNTLTFHEVEPGYDEIYTRKN